MINIEYINTDIMTDVMFNRLLTTLPESQKAEVVCMHFRKDQKLKLMSRIMIQNCIQNEGFSWNDLKLGEQGKPYISGMLNFNISHSGSMVVGAFSSAKIGVDVEVKGEFDQGSITELLHPKEQEHINNHQDSKASFYSIWTKKEAFLKAIGTGLINDLERYDCTSDSILENSEHWYIKPLNGFDEYAVAVCQNQPIKEIKMNQRNIEYYIK